MKRVSLTGATALGGMGRFAALAANQTIGFPRIAFEQRDATLTVGQMEDVVAGLKESVKKVHETVQEHGKTLKDELVQHGKAAQETKDKVDQALTATTDLTARVKQAEILLAGMGEGGSKRPKTIGQIVTESKEYEAFRTGKGKQSCSIDVGQVITSVTTDADGSAGDLIAPDRRSLIIAPQMRRMTVRDLLMPGRTTSNMIQYNQETGFTNGAAVQATEGTEKGESTLKFELVSTNVATIAHWMDASKQVLDDAAMLRSWIDMRLRYGLRLKEEDELLNGDGTGGDLSGLILNSTPYDPAFTPEEMTPIDILRLAMLQVALAEWGATGHVLNPIDWARIELTKDLEGRYIFSNPLQLAGPSLWGIPVVPTQAMTPTKFLTGAFVPAAQIFDREDANVTMSNETGDNFKKNLVTILAEQRLALAVYRPEAMVYGDLSENS